MNVAAGPLLPLMDEDQTAPLWHLTIPEVKDVIVGELAECGEWIVANIQTGSIWPVNAQKVQYRGETLWIVPVMKKFYPAVAMKVPQGKSRIECEQLVMRFISTLSWVESWGFIVEGLGGGSLPAPMARDKEQGFAICEEFDLSYFPEPDNEKALLALALMREGRGLNHPTYAFLSFFRILEVAFPNSTARTKWMNDSVGSIQGHRRHRRPPVRVGPLRDRTCSEIARHRSRRPFRHQTPSVRTADHDCSRAESDRGGSRYRDEPDGASKASLRIGWVQRDSRVRDRRPVGPR